MPASENPQANWTEDRIEHDQQTLVACPECSVVQRIWVDRICKYDENGYEADTYFQSSADEQCSVCGQETLLKDDASNVIDPDEDTGIHL